MGSEMCIRDSCWVHACTAPGRTRYLAARAAGTGLVSMSTREARDWSTYSEYSYGNSSEANFYLIHPYLRTRVGYVLCTTYVQPGISSYVPGMSRLPRYVYVDTYEPVLHPPPKKEQNAQHTYQHVCTWYQPAPNIRICRYLCTNVQPVDAHV